MILQETFVIEDCVKYYDSTYSNAQVVNLDLPTDYKIEFTLFSNSSTQSSGGRSNVCFMRFDSSSNGYVGKGGTSSRNISIESTSLPNGLPVDTNTDYVLTKSNNVLTLSDGTDTITVNKSTYTKLYSLNGSSDGQIKNIKVKAL